MVDEIQFKEMKALGMCANIFTNHIYYWGDQHAAKTVGLERAVKMNATKTALDLGVPFSLHCDASVTPIAPLFNAWTAVNRVTASGKTFREDLKISVAEALYAMTMGTAYLLKLEEEIGSITVGKKADFVILGEDPYTSDPMHLKDISVITTVFAGQITRNNF
jgi:predicted amidohydrolase YtcJ